MSVKLLEQLQGQLSNYSPSRKWLRSFRERSSVAMVLQVRDDELHILMIKRAERKGDPWSGHMAFPGGRMDKTDANAYAVALRETEEEVGLTLGSQDRCIGRLSDLNARPKRSALGMVVSPFVFHLEREVAFTPNYEVAEVVWVPMPYLLNPDNLDRMQWEFKGAKIPMPCYFYEERCIWGLSLMMLNEMLDLIDGGSRRLSWRR